MDEQTLIVDRHLWVHENHPLAASIRKRMVFANPVYENAQRAGRRVPDGVEKEIVLYEKVGVYYRFPRALVHKLRDRFPVVDRTVVGEAVDMPVLVSPRDYQVGVLDTVETALRANYGTVMQAEAGWGKTIGSLILASKLGRKTLIMVHKEFLMTQWVERILGTEAGRKKLGVKAKPKEVLGPALGLDPDEVGIVQQDRVEWRGKKIVVAMVQSLAAREYEAEFYESFGLIITDETHRAAAPTFQKAITLFPAAKRLGVTATPKRKDGLEDIFFYHIGSISARGKVPRVTPRIQVVKMPVAPTPEEEKKMKRFGKWDNVRVIDYITTHPSRNAKLVQLLLQAASKGRKILVLSERRAHLELLKEEFVTAAQAQEAPYSTDFYVGGMDLTARTRAEQMQVLFATWQMAEEGLDIASLDTLLMATPRTGIEQAVGRIQRIKEGKKTPVVVDPVDNHIPPLKKRYDKRDDEYRKLGWAA